MARFNAHFLRGLVKSTRNKRRAAGTFSSSTTKDVEYIDPRGQEQFLELENQLRIFRSSLYPSYKDFIRMENGPNGPPVIDANMYSAHIIPAAYVEVLPR